MWGTGTLLEFFIFVLLLLHYNFLLTALVTSYLTNSDFCTQNVWRVYEICFLLLLEIKLPNSWNYSINWLLDWFLYWLFLQVLCLIYRFEVLVLYSLHLREKMYFLLQLLKWELYLLVTLKQMFVNTMFCYKLNYQIKFQSTNNHLFDW